MSTNTPNEKGTPQSRTYTVNDIAAILGIGRASAYKLANSGLFKTIRIGNMIRISRKSFEDWLNMEKSEGGNPSFKIMTQIQRKRNNPL